MKDLNSLPSAYLTRLKLELRIVALFAFSMAAPGCTAEYAAETEKPAPPAKVEQAVKESDLSRVTLTPEAEARLGIRVAQVERSSVTRAHTFAGEVVLPPDSAITVSAPVAGTILSSTGAAPSAGTIVKKGQSVFRLLPLLAPERNARAVAERDLSEAETRFETAKLKYDRAEQLLRDKAGSVRQVEEAREQLRLAEFTLKAARENFDRIMRSPLEADTSVEITSPDSGMIQKIHVGTGQKVAPSAALFDIACLATVWVRVPVYVGDLGAVDRNQSASIHNLGDSPGSPTLTARPIAAPPSANAQAATVDLYFLLPGPGAFRPGQKVGVTLALLGSQESLIVPNSALVRDIHGGEWVYENLAPQQYARRRVEVRYVTGTQAVLARGPAEGTKVVITGAAELFATEFSSGK